MREGGGEASEHFLRMSASDEKLIALWFGFDIGRLGLIDAYDFFVEGTYVISFFSVYVIVYNYGLHRYKAGSFSVQYIVSVHIVRYAIVTGEYYNRRITVLFNIKFAKPRIK